MHKIHFGPYAQPACLAEEKHRDLYQPGTVALLSGWGNTDGYGATGNTPQFLQEAKLVVRDIKDCKNAWQKTYDKKTYDSKFGYF